jgi:hypothetical protein
MMAVSTERAAKRHTEIQNAEAELQRIALEINEYRIKRSNILNKPVSLLDSITCNK